MHLFQSIITLLFLSSSWIVVGQSIFEITVKFENLETNDGFVMLLVQDVNEKDVSKLVLPIQNKEALTTLKLSAGNYGFSAYHDENSNEKLDKNFVGAPNEAYGFSNDARGTFSKPDFSETLVKISGNQIITFKLE